MSLMQELAYSKHSEMVLLGYAISSADSLKAVCTLLKKEDFHSTQHQCLFSALQELYQKAEPLDIRQLCEELKSYITDQEGNSCLNRAVKLFLDYEQAQECLQEVKRFSLLREMLSPDFSPQSSLVTCGSLARGRTWLSAFPLRYYVFFKNTILVGNCEERIGHKVLIDLKAFDVTAQEQTKG